jgi:hypothetical protein
MAGAQALDNEKAAVRELWSIADFAEAHAISKRQVYVLIERGDVEGVSIGRRTLVTEASRLAWLANLPRKRAPLSVTPDAPAGMP